MSFVGPRPERQVFIDKIMEVAPRYVHVYKMRPGLTSMATLYNGYTDTMEKMVKRLDMDLEYLTTRSLWGDLVIVVKTALTIISGKKF
jgi:lipopolysaccharide/colanic/teichoic acid biosynthesis glycosyltransferase